MGAELIELAAASCPASALCVMANILDIKNVTKIFRGGVLAVDDVMLGVEEGEFLTILGPSGCLFARAHEIWSDAVE